MSEPKKDVPAPESRLCSRCYAVHPGVSCYWHAHGKTAADKTPGGKTFTLSSGEPGCAECCNGDRCDDPSHHDRDSCPYCLGSGKPACVPATAAPSQPAREWQKQLITGVDGDCLRAAFANCLGLRVEDLPHFENDAWFDSWTAWFRERGIGLVWYGFRDGLSYDFPGLYVLSVTSPRLEGKKHCVVARDGQIVFDPHPDADNTPADPATANGAYLFTILDAQQNAAKDAEIERLTAIAGDLTDRNVALTEQACKLQDDVAAIVSSHRSDWSWDDVLSDVRDLKAAERERDSLRAWAQDAFIVVEALNIGTTWELSPAVKKELARLSKEAFELAALKAGKDGQQ